MFLCLCSIFTFAQEKDVTKFLGIPIDGSKDEMIRKLCEKGYRTTANDNEILEGKFNGRQVFVYVVTTNNDKVYRIMVSDANTVGKREILFRFNRLCQQFENNPKYIPYLENQKIPEDEDISYEMNVNNKCYMATFFQYTDSDSPSVETLQSTYSQEELRNKTNEQLAFDYLTRKMVWFTISKFKEEYYISIYYDNSCNQANGEDL